MSTTTCTTQLLNKQPSLNTAPTTVIEYFHHYYHYQHFHYLLGQLKPKFLMSSSGIVNLPKTIFTPNS